MKSKYTKGIILKSVGYKNTLAKTRIFPVTECGVSMIVIQRLVLAPASNFDGFEHYRLLRNFSDKKLLLNEMVFYTESFDLLIDSFKNVNNQI